jgi:hypothetical protein
LTHLIEEKLNEIEAEEKILAVKKRSKRIAGLSHGKIWMSDDFDAPLEFRPSEQ